MMSLETFEMLSLKIGISGLILYMMFILYRLCKESKAGRYGTLIIFGTLGLGILGFVSKEVIIAVLDL